MIVAVLLGLAACAGADAPGARQLPPPPDDDVTGAPGDSRDVIEVPSGAFGFFAPVASLRSVGFRCARSIDTAGGVD